MAVQEMSSYVLYTFIVPNTVVIIPSPISMALDRMGCDKHNSRDTQGDMESRRKDPNDESVVYPDGNQAHLIRAVLI